MNTPPIIELDTPLVMLTHNMTARKYGTVFKCITARCVSSGNCGIIIMARNHGQSAVLFVGAETVPTRARDIRATSNLL